MVRWGAMGWLLVLWGCSSSASYDLQVRFSPGRLADRVQTIELSLVKECPSEDRVAEEPTGVIETVELRRGSIPSFRNRKAGHYGVLARGRRMGDCRVVAAGCDPVVFTDGGGAAEVILKAVSGGPVCPNGVTCHASTGVCDGDCEDDGGQCIEGEGGLCDGGVCEIQCDTPCPDVAHGKGMCVGINECAVTCDFGYKSTASACAPDVGQQTVDGAGDPGRRSWAAVDGDGRVVVLYAASFSTTPALKYAVLEGGTWTLGNFAPSAFADRVAMGTLPSGNVAVAYAEGDYNVRFATLVNGAWVNEGVGDFVGPVDPVGVGVSGTNPMVAWISKFATRIVGSWNVVATQAPQNTLYAYSVAVLPNGHFSWPAFTLVAPGTVQVAVAEWNGTAATTSPQISLVASGSSYANALVAGDDDSHTHLIYSNGTSLYYATNAAGSWSNPGLITAASGLNLGEHQMVVHDGVVALSYHPESGNNTINYAYRTADAIWHKVVAVDLRNTAVGAGTSMAVDSGGGVHLFYYGTATGSLEYAYLPEGLSR